MSSSSRSPLLPPYAMPSHDTDAGASDARDDRPIVSSAPQPFVPPSFVGEVPFAAVSVPALSGEEDVGNFSGYADPDAISAQDSDLPWIEDFGETLPSDSSADAFDDVAADAFASNNVSQDDSDSDDLANTWAIDEAGPSISHIANDLASASAPPPAGSAQLGAHTPWADDEAWMDIMPTLPNTGSHDPGMDTSWARAFAEPMAPMTPPPIPGGDTQAAAASLEAIARRLRAGEISVPGFKAESGDAAALAATLSALLGAQS